MNDEKFKEWFFAIKEDLDRKKNAKKSKVNKRVTYEMMMLYGAQMYWLGILSAFLQIKYISQHQHDIFKSLINSYAYKNDKED